MPSCRKGNPNTKIILNLHLNDRRGFSSADFLCKCFSQQTLHEWMMESMELLGFFICTGAAPFITSWTIDLCNSFKFWNFYCAVAGLLHFWSFRHHVLTPRGNSPWEKNKNPSNSPLRVDSWTPPDDDDGEICEKGICFSARSCARCMYCKSTTIFFNQAFFWRFDGNLLIVPENRLNLFKRIVPTWFNLDCLGQ